MISYISYSDKILVFRVNIIYSYTSLLYNLSYTIYSYISYSDMDLKENLLHGSESSIAEPVQTIREGLPRPRSGEFRALFEGNTPWHWGITISPTGTQRATIWVAVRKTQTTKQTTTTRTTTNSNTPIDTTNFTHTQTDTHTCVYNN